MDTGERDLSWILGRRDSVAALEGYYGQVWDRILREVALGLGRPGAAQRTGLVLRLKALVGLLDPYRQTVVRRWIRDWASAALALGEENAAGGIESQLGSADPAQQAAFGEISKKRNVAAATVAAGLVSSTDAQLASLAALMQSSLIGIVQRVQGAMIGRGTSPGVLAGAANHGILTDLSDLVLRGPSQVALRALRQRGLPSGLLSEIGNLSQGFPAGPGGRLISPMTSAGMFGGGMISDGHSAGIRIRSAANDVNHVRISNPHRVGEPDVCTVFAGRVFYIGLGADPLGFPKLSSVPNGGPKFHPHCRHSLQPFVVRLKSTKEVETELAASIAIPSDFFHVKPYAVTKVVRKMNAGQINKINPGSRAPRNKEKVA